MQKQFSLQFLQNEPKVSKSNPSSNPILATPNERPRIDDNLVKARQKEVVRIGARKKNRSGRGVAPNLVALLEQMHIGQRTNSINARGRTGIKLARQKPSPMMESASIDLAVKKPLPLTTIVRIDPCFKKPPPRKGRADLVVKKTSPMKEVSRVLRLRTNIRS